MIFSSEALMHRNLHIESLYREGLDLVSALGIKRLQALSRKSASVLSTLSPSARYDLDSTDEQQHERITQIRRQLCSISTSTEPYATSIDAIKRMAELEKEFSKCVVTVRDRRHFFHTHGLSWLFAHEIVNFIPFEPTFLAAASKKLRRVLNNQSRFYTSSETAQRYSVSKQRLRRFVSTYLPELSIVRGQVSKRAWRGGFTQAYETRQEKRAYCVILSGQLDEEQKTYVLAHELGHCLHFESQKTKSAIFQLEYPEVAKEAIAEFFAYTSLRQLNLNGALSTFIKEQHIRLDEFDLMVKQLTKASSKPNELSLDDVYDRLLPGMVLILLWHLIETKTTNVDDFLSELGHEEDNNTMCKIMRQILLS